MKRVLLAAASVLLPALAIAANTIVSVTQVTETVNVADDTDYVITSTTPFGDAGIVNISGSSTLILKNVIPTEALKLKDHIRIGGSVASNGSNCMFKVYGNGCIVLAHGSSVTAFTAYSNADYTGDVYTWKVGTARVSLADNVANNNIRSFVLKRGYMVCLATRSDGTGYSRVYIADAADRKVVLPQILSGTVSSLRVMQWNDCGKRGYSGGDATVLDALNATWFYDWNCGGTATSDWEYVPQHHHEGWPSISAIGSSNHSPHALANNEPDNTSDSREQVNTVDDVLANWPAMMATGKRLGSPAVSGNYNWLYQFIDSIDARGWRCDFIAVHAYWYSDWSSWYNTLKNIHSRTGRPIWITEMNYGANWTGWPGSDTSGSDANFAIEKQHFAPVIDGLENTGWMERYAVYNWVQDCRSMYLNNALTPMGKYYADKETNVGYNSSYEKVPSLPRQYDPSNLVATYDKGTHKVTLTWHEPNGEYNRSMVIQQKLTGSSQWTALKTVTQQELEADYTETVDGQDGYKYRILVTDVSNKSRYSNEATAVNDNLEFGDEVTTAGSVMYLGGNLLVNGDFEMGLAGWENGAGDPLSAPYFQAVALGGVDNSSYLQCYGSSTSSTDAQSLRKVLTLTPNTYYYVSAAGCNNNPSYQRISTTAIEKVELNLRIQMQDVSEWAKQGSSFQVTSDTTLLIQFRNLEGKAQFDDIVVARLFETREEALADAFECEKQRVAAFKAYNTWLPSLNDQLDKLVASSTPALQLEAAVSQSLQAIKAAKEIENLKPNALLVVEYGLPGHVEVSEVLNAIAGTTTAQDYIDALAKMKASLDTSMVYTSDDSFIQTPDFASASGWNTKTGSYTGGDQKYTTQAGQTCWNAWWSLSAAGNEQQTMAVSQQVKGLSHGLYALEVKATTQHLCETDQHGFLIHGTDTVQTNTIPYGLLDLPAIDNGDKWQTLASPYLYVQDGDTVTIGFEGSKQGAVDGCYIPYASPTSTGDNREGWWCATDFTLRQIPVYMTTVGTSRWGTICLPCAFSCPDGVQLYRLAGIRADDYSLCLEEETDAVKAGYPYIYHCTNDGQIAFLESGTKVKIANTNYNGLRGALSASARYPLSSLCLVDGTWTYVTDRNAAGVIKSYSGYVQKLGNLTVLASWDGLTMPTSGIPEGSVDIPGIEMQQDGEVSPMYNVYGQRVGQDATGLLIQSGKKVYIAK